MITTASRQCSFRFLTGNGEADLADALHRTGSKDRSVIPLIVAFSIRYFILLFSVGQRVASASSRIHTVGHVVVSEEAICIRAMSSRDLPSRQHSGTSAIPSIPSLATAHRQPFAIRTQTALARVRSFLSIRVCMPASERAL